ncbi:unnamed protein product [Owenia fusiformis]|uniref:Uncharacterized protein n=1 Tax=Owenia fusiformis TaxID=6347 RepID=A0A8J1TES5_OWEFU|nr:unnamed protein product [Owenia fusiformis]
MHCVFGPKLYVWISTILPFLLLVNCHSISRSSPTYFGEDTYPRKTIDRYDDYGANNKLWKLIKIILGRQQDNMIAAPKDGTIVSDKRNIEKRIHFKDALKKRSIACCHSVADRCGHFAGGPGCMQALEARMCGSMGLC